MNRRHFLQGLAGLAGIGTIGGLYTWQVEPFWLEFVRLKMPVRHLPKSLEGRTLMQISDIHVGNRFDWQFLIDSFQKAQELQPDIVVYTGDYVSYEDATQFEQLTTVMQDAVQGNLGTYAILGNHDYGVNWQEAAVGERIAGILRAAQIDVLRNETRTVDGLNILGLDDCWGTNFKPEMIFDHWDKTAANIVLCHNPDVADMPIWNGYQGWILAGHTHGGQCKPPFLTPPVLPVKNKRYSAGVIDLYDGRQLYINRALGHLWQVRFNVRPEITLFELTASTT